MKRILVVLGIVFGYTLIVECASVGAPSFLPERGRYIMAVEYNSVNGRDLSDATLGSLLLDTEGKHYVGKVIYGLSDRISIVGKLASSELQLYDQNASSTYNHNSDLGWGLGFRAILYEDLDLGLSLGTGAQYFTFEPKATSAGRTAEWTEWDASIYMSIVNIVSEAKSLVEPFLLTSTAFHAGFRASDASVDWTSGFSSGTLDSDTNFGYFAGFDFVFSDNYILGFEARFSDETAFTTVLGFKF